MALNGNSPSNDVRNIDATPLIWAPLDALYEAFCQIPCGTSDFDLMTQLLRVVAASLATDAALSAACGVNRFTPYMDLDDARQRSCDLLEMLGRLVSRKDSGGAPEQHERRSNE